MKKSPYGVNHDTRSNKTRNGLCLQSWLKHLVKAFLLRDTNKLACINTELYIMLQTSYPQCIPDMKSRAVVLELTGWDYSLKLV